MKTKKLIAVLLIAVIISSLLPNLVSYAAEPNFLLSIDGNPNTTKVVNVGDIVEVSLDFTDGLENQKGLGVVLAYDNTKLEVQADYEGELEVGGSLSNELAMNYHTAQAMIEDKTITIAYGTNRVLATSGNVVKIKFKVLVGGTHTVSVSGIKYSDNPLESNSNELPVESNTAVNIVGNIPLESLTVTPATATLEVGDSTGFSFVKDPVDATMDGFTWSSSDTNVIKVGASGIVTAVGPGEAFVRITSGTVVGEAKVTVTAPIQDIKFKNVENNKITIHKGKYFTVEAEKLPGNTTTTDPITWSSDNNAVATVDETGKITAVAPGTTTITAKCADKEKTLTVIVDAPLKGISLKNKEMALDVNESDTLEVNIDPIDTTDDVTATWTSSDENIATVDSNGKVTAKGHGQTTITVKIGTYTDTATVTVNAHLDNIVIVNDALDSDDKLTLKKGKEATLEIDYQPEVFAESKTIKWESSNEDVATVVNGVVKAIAPGTTTITATSVNNKKDTIIVEVPVVELEDVTIDKADLTIEKGSSETLTAVVSPEDTTDNKTITWSSSDDTVATVDANGKVTAVGVGTATITATAAGKTDTCTVTVTCKLESIKLDKTEMTLEAGKTADALVVTKNPTDATVDVADTKWTSLNKEVATVDANGKVTAVAPGTAVIQAELDGQIAKCTVTVIVTLTGVEIENGSETLELKKTQTAELKVVYTPSNATEIPNATWTSSDEEVATVDQNGKVTALKEGTTTITVDYGNGIKAIRKVNVTEIHVDSIAIDKVIESMNKGQVASLKVVINPEDTTDDKTITWSTSDDKVISVDEEGNIKALKAGKATITATSVNGKTDSMEIEVKEVALESIKVSAKDTKVEEGKTTQIEVTLNPEDATDDLTFKYTSSNESIATVDKNGKVTAKKAGDVVITVEVSALNGEGQETVLKSQTNLTVKEKPASGGSTGGTQAPAAPAPVAGLTTSPHTGDMNVVALATMMIISLVGMILVIKKK